MRCLELFSTMSLVEVSDEGVSSSKLDFTPLLIGMAVFVSGLSTGVVIIDKSLFIIIVSSFSIAAALSRSFALNFHLCSILKMVPNSWFNFLNFVFCFLFKPRAIVECDKIQGWMKFYVLMKICKRSSTLKYLFQAKKTLVVACRWNFSIVKC